MGLSLTKISHRFGDLLAVDGATLSAASGEIVCLFGPSGCGKTTLLRLAAGLEPLQAGEVALDREIIAAPGRETPPEKRPIGFVFQDYVLFPHLTVQKNIAFGLKGVRNAKALIAAQLEALGIADLAPRFPHELSGGQQQRVALARALVRKPRAILMDEPFASIDGALRRRLREDLRRVLKDQKAAVVLVTHDAEEALTLGDSIALMRAGKIVETASPQELFDNPKTPEGAGLFPGCQRIAGEVRQGVFQSPLGEGPAPGLPDGPARAILRADCLTAIEDGAGAFHVSDARFAGPGWTAHLEGPGGLTLSVPMDAAPPRGAAVSVTPDWEKAFIFSG